MSTDDGEKLFRSMQPAQRPKAGPGTTCHDNDVHFFLLNLKKIMDRAKIP
jgi:hypothetical protein